MRNSCTLSLAFGLWFLASSASAEPPDFLILRSGGTLVGRVTPDGAGYALRSLTGTGESRYPVQAVAKVCKGPLEAYQFLKQSITPDEPLDRCRLARFCITHDLLAEARAELNAALKLDGRCSEAKTLLIQLDLKKKKPTVHEAAVPALPTSPVLPIPPARLDDWPLALTPAGQQDFGQRVQPMLLVGCGTGACHGVAEGKRAFLLTRGLYGVSPSPLTTRTNLERVLGVVNKEHPDVSLLLTKGHEKHGGAKGPPLDAQSYAVLRQWVHTMAGRHEAVAKAERKEPAATVGPTRNTNEFAAGDSPPTLGASETDPRVTLPPIPGLAGGAARQLGVPEAKSDAKPETKPAAEPSALPPAAPAGALPPIPGLTGNAAVQLGQRPAPPQQTPKRSTPASDTKPPPAAAPPQAGAPKNPDPKDNPAFWDYAKLLGFAPPVANVTREPPKQMRVPNGAAYRTAWPDPPDIPVDVFVQLVRQALAEKSPPSAEATPGKALFLNGGTVVNAPPK